MASVLGANPFPSCSGGEWFSCTLRYCPVFTQLCQCHWTSFLPPPLIPHHIYTNLVLCLLPRPHIGQSGWYERHWLSERSQETVILQFCPWAGVWRLYGAIRGRASIRAIQSMHMSKSPQSSPALGARACCQLLWLHVLCRQWSLLFDRGKLRRKSTGNGPRGLLWSEYMPALLQLPSLSRVSLLSYQDSKAGDEQLCVWFRGKALWKTKMQGISKRLRACFCERVWVSSLFTCSVLI